jgi:hypothetical protein
VTVEPIDESASVALDSVKEALSFSPSRTPWSRRSPRPRPDPRIQRTRRRRPDNRVRRIPAGTNHTSPHSTLPIRPIDRIQHASAAESRNTLRRSIFRENQEVRLIGDPHAPMGGRLTPGRERNSLFHRRSTRPTSRSPKWTPSCGEPRRRQSFYCMTVPAAPNAISRSGQHQH